MFAEHGRFLYRFSSEETREKFRKDPERYSIQLDGACARMGAPTTGNPDSYFIHEHRIYIFGSSDCYKKFSANPAKYLQAEQPKAEWNPTPQTRERGAAALKAVLAAMGGEARWNGVHAYTEVRKIAQNNSVMTYTVRLPDSLYTETVNGSNLITNVASLELGSSTFNGRRTQYPSSFARAVAGDLRNQLIVTLARAGDKDFEVYELSAGHLRIRNRDTYVTLFVDVTTHRASALTWIGRTPDGFSEIRAAYSDYRETDGLTVPFRIDATVKGSDVVRSWTIESYRINPTDVDAVFALKVN